MYKKALFALMVAISLLGSQASVAVAETNFAVGDKWAFGKEIDLMEEIRPQLDELEGNITELMESEEAEMVKNASGLELKSFDLANKAVLGFYYTGEVVDDFDQMIHMQTEQSLYSHTVLGTKFTTMMPGEGEHNLLLKVWCEDEDWDEEKEDCGEDGEDGQIALLDNNTGEPLVLEEVDTTIGGSMHYVAKMTQDTWWTQDTHELARTELTIAIGAAGGITIKNVPNLTHDGNGLYAESTNIVEEGQFECNDGEYIPFEYANDGWEDCDDGSDEPGNGYDFECDNGDTYPMDYVNDGIWHCEDGEDEGEGDGDTAFSVCEEKEESKEYLCYETVDLKFETAIFEMSSEASIHLVFDFGDDPLNAMNLPLEENKYWDGDMSRLTISGDVGGKVDIKKPELSLCPDNDCDQLPEMQELYSGLTEAIEELHNNESFSVTVDRNNDGLPDVITGWNDIFPMYIPETWMDQIFQEILEEISCEDDDSAQEGEDCDETAEEEFKRLNLRIENNRFAFGPYSVHEIEDFSPIPYAFEAGEKETATASDGTVYEGYQVFPSDQCSENNPERDDEDCDREDDDDGDDDRDDDDGGIIPGDSRSGHDGDHEDDCEGDPFCDSEIIWFHDAENGHPAYINMDMPNLKEDGYRVEMMPIESSVAKAKVDANADAENPEKTELIEFDAEDIEEDSALPGFGIMAAGASLLFVSRRFRN